MASIIDARPVHIVTATTGELDSIDTPVRVAISVSKITKGVDLLRADDQQTIGGDLAQVILEDGLHDEVLPICTGKGHAGANGVGTGAEDHVDAENQNQRDGDGDQQLRQREAEPVLTTDY